MEKKIERYPKEFLRDKGSHSDGLHLVAWDDICKPKRLGNLGINRICDMNKTLLFKWSWRFGRESESLWRQVIVSKYGLSNDRMFKAPPLPYGCSCWKAIMNSSVEFF